MEYLLKATAIIIIFYVIYKLFLQRDTFFESNRWFLIIGLVASLIIPFIVIPIYSEYTPTTFEGFVLNDQISTEIIEKPFNILDYLPLIYALGVAFFSTRFFIHLLSLAKIIHKNKGIKKDHFIFIETRNNTSPFSFFNWIVYNPETFNQTELQHIIEHEKTHANQYHSIDILLSQLFCIVFWINPFVWLYNKDLKQNLEFIADKLTLKQYSCKKSYQYTLLKTSMPSHQMALSNQFYNSLIKKRIVMLHKSKSKKINQLKYLLVFPSIVLFLIGCNSEVIANESEKEQQLKINPITKTGYRISAMEDDQQPLFVLNGKIISAEEMSAIIPDSIRSMTVIKNKNAIVKYGDKAKNVAIEIDNVKVVGNVANSDTIKINSNYIETHTAETNTIRIQGNHLFNLANPLIIVDGKEMLDKNTKDIDPDNVQSISVLKKETATKKYGDKGKNGVIEITSKK